MTFDPCESHINVSSVLHCIGKKVPLSIQNDLLALVAYEGLGNTAVTSEDLSDVFVNWPREKSGTQSMESGAQSVESGTQSVESGTREEGHPAGAIASEEGDTMFASSVVGGSEQPFV